MRFLVITNAPTLIKKGLLCAYAPYVREMDIWSKYVDEFRVFSPNEYTQDLLTKSFQNQPELLAIPALQFNSIVPFLNSLLNLPIITFKLFKVMFWADHIHLRCPGNIGLIGCVVQIFFPKKSKTAKYAGNWDPKSKQPLSYRFQKWILSNTFLTRNMQVLVYGDWKHQTKNIKPFFTATYYKSEIVKPQKRDYSDDLKFIFIGSLVDGKRPLLAIQIIKALNEQGKHVSLDIYGEGVLKEELQKYIAKKKLETIIVLHGNQSKEIIKESLKKAHFSILPSKSEGWPKAIAESMFFGVIPIATSVSCVPYMLNYGNRGVLIEANLKRDVILLKNTLNDVSKLEFMSEQAANWSQSYTLDVFESEISKLLNH